MAHLRRSTTTGRLLKNAAGHLVNECCPCDPDEIPSSITIDLTNLDASGCAQGTPCSPDDAATIVIDLAGVAYDGTYCHYYTDFGAGHLCWGGYPRTDIRLWWSASSCRWLISFSHWNQSSTLYGPSTHRDPTGIYRPGPTDCVTGVLEVS